MRVRPDAHANGHAGTDAGREHSLPVPVEAGERLYREFLAGRSPNTLNAYAEDLAAFAAYQGAGSAGEALEALIGLPAGEGNSRLLAWRAAMLEAGLAPATDQPSALGCALGAALRPHDRRHDWVPGIQGLKAQSYRDTRGPGLAGTRALLGQPRRSRRPRLPATWPSSG